MGHTTLAYTATAANGSGKNKDGGVGAATQAPVLTTPQPSRHPSPTTKATTLGYLIFERPDLDLAEKYLTDFGLRVVSRDADRLFLRGTGEAPTAMSPYGRNSPASPGSASPSRRLTICENSAAFPAPPRSRTSIGPARAACPPHRSRRLPRRRRLGTGPGPAAGAPRPDRAQRPDRIVRVNDTQRRPSPRPR